MTDKTLITELSGAATIYSCLQHFFRRVHAAVNRSVSHERTADKIVRVGYKFF